MSNEQENASLRKQKSTQNIDEKSRILKLAFANHNRHISIGLIKETINSAKKNSPISESKKSIEKSDNEKNGKTIQEIDREKLDKKFSKKKDVKPN